MWSELENKPDLKDKLMVYFEETYVPKRLDLAYEISMQIEANYPGETLKLLKEAVNIAYEHNASITTKLIIRIAEIYFRKGQLFYAKEYVEKAIEEHAKGVKEINSIRLLNFLGGLYFHDRELTISFSYILEAYNKALSENVLNQQAFCLSNFGHIFNYIGHTEKANHFYRSAVVKYEKLLELHPAFSADVDSQTQYIYYEYFFSLIIWITHFYQNYSKAGNSDDINRKLQVLKVAYPDIDNQHIKILIDLCDIHQLLESNNEAIATDKMNEIEIVIEKLAYKEEMRNFLMIKIKHALFQNDLDKALELTKHRFFNPINLYSIPQCENLFQIYTMNNSEKAVDFCNEIIQQSKTKASLVYISKWAYEKLTELEETIDEKAYNYAKEQYQILFHSILKFSV